MSLPTLNRAAFRAWLAGMEPGAKLPGLPCDCPLDAYLRCAWGLACPCVTYQAYGPEKNRHRLPKWAARFVPAIDAFCEDRSFGWGRLTAAECLAVLDAVPEDLR